MGVLNAQNQVEMSDESVGPEKLSLVGLAQLSEDRMVGLTEGGDLIEMGGGLQEVSVLAKATGLEPLLDGYFGYTLRMTCAGGSKVLLLDRRDQLWCFDLKRKTLNHLYDCSVFVDNSLKEIDFQLQSPAPVPSGGLLRSKEITSIAARANGEIALGGVNIDYLLQAQP